MGIQELFLPFKPKMYLPPEALLITPTIVSTEMTTGIPRTLDLISSTTGIREFFLQDWDQLVHFHPFSV